MNEPTIGTRRDFLRTSVLGAALSWTVPVFIERTFLTLNAEAADSALQTKTGRDNPILVVIQLAGGNDGLNALVPFADDAYYRARPTIHIPREKVLNIDGAIGLNPVLAPLKSLFDAGHLSMIQGVGYPNPNRSHFRSTEIWQTAPDSNQYVRTGWLGRYFDNCCSGKDPTAGVSVTGQLPQAFTAEEPVGLAYRGRSGFIRAGNDMEKQAFDELNGLGSDHDVASGETISQLSGPNESGMATIEYLQRVALDAQIGSDRIAETLKRVKTEAAYPRTPIANSLSVIARLIAGGMPTRVYYASQGGYDTHNQQENSHNRLLENLANALAAFCQDLQSKGVFDRVLVMTFSEFGRRVAENASRGTDHGTAAPMFICGGGVKPGLFGRQPSLDHLDEGDLIHTTDFRSVYGTILDKWMQASAAKVLGKNYPAIGFV
jgi:uncharacterized protein (DUF1501 family)